MTKEGFNWKSIFINENQEENKNSGGEINTELKTTFPQELHTNQRLEEVGNPYLSEIQKVYEKGFESLNSPNFDFFEFYKSVISVGVNNSQSYQMAYAMGSAMNTELSKTTLLEKAKYYISEIEKVHKGYQNTGTIKKTELSKNINNEKKNLETDILNIEKSILNLQNELNEKRNQFNKIDGLNSSEFNELESKLQANEFAMKKLTSSINQVVSGINQYL